MEYIHPDTVKQLSNTTFFLRAAMGCLAAGLGLAAGCARPAEPRDTAAVGYPAALVLDTHDPPVPTLPSGRGYASYRRGWGPLSGPISNRNANPLNIKVGGQTRQYLRAGAARVSAIEPLDGGRFLAFHTPTAGFRAGLELLTGTVYRDLGIDQALRRWSNQGYGAEILAGTQLDARSRVRQLTRSDFGVLLSAMARAEGYQSPTMRQEIATALTR